MPATVFSRHSKNLIQKKEVVLTKKVLLMLGKTLKHKPGAKASS
jgi:hypothetical protein